MELDDPKKKLKYGIKKRNRTIPRIIGERKSEMEPDDPKKKLRTDFIGRPPKVL